MFPIGNDSIALYMVLANKMKPCFVGLKKGKDKENHKDKDKGKKICGNIVPNWEQYNQNQQHAFEGKGEVLETQHTLPPFCLHGVPSYP